jgi:hypothetical protein
MALAGELRAGIPETWPKVGFSEEHHRIVGVLENLVGDDPVGLDDPALASELGTLCAAQWLHARSRDGEAAERAGRLAPTSLHARPATCIVLAALRRLLLREHWQGQETERYVAPIASVIRYLAQHPKDAQVRAALSQCLSVESSGVIGAVAMAAIALRASEHPLEVDAQPAVPVSQATRDSTEAFIDAALTWLRERHTIEFGVTVLPEEIALPYPKRVVQETHRRPAIVKRKHGEGFGGVDGYGAKGLARDPIQA